MLELSGDKAFQTKLEFVDALNELAGMRPFDRIGVVDIAQAAGMSRSTFYYHFADRNAAVQWLSRTAFERGIDQIGRGLSFFSGHFATTRILIRYKTLITAAAEDGSYTGAERSFIRNRSANLRETLALRGIAADEELLFQVRALAACEQSMTSAYIKGELGEMEPRSFCTLLGGIVPERLRRALED